MEIPEGYVLMPLDATAEMIAAGKAAESRVEVIYAAMVAARPSASLLDSGEFPELDDDLPGD